MISNDRWSNMGLSKIFGISLLVFILIVSVRVHAQGTPDSEIGGVGVSTEAGVTENKDQDGMPPVIPLPHFARR